MPVLQRIQADQLSERHRKRDKGQAIQNCRLQTSVGYTAKHAAASVEVSGKAVNSNEAAQRNETN